MSIITMFSLLKERINNSIYIYNVHKLSDFVMKPSNGTLCISMINIMSDKIKAKTKDFKEFFFVNTIKQTADLLIQMNKDLNTPYDDVAVVAVSKALKQTSSFIDASLKSGQRKGKP